MRWLGLRLCFPVASCRMRGGLHPAQVGPQGAAAFRDAMAAASMSGLRRSRNFMMELALRKAPRRPIKPLTRFRVARGDTVEIISNPAVSDDVGKQGKVLRVDRKKNKVYVEGIAMVSRNALSSPALVPGSALPVRRGRRRSAPNPARREAWCPLRGPSITPTWLL